MFWGGTHLFRSCFWMAREHTKRIYLWGFLLDADPAGGDPRTQHLLDLEGGGGEGVTS